MNGMPKSKLGVIIGYIFLIGFVVSVSLQVLSVQHDLRESAELADSYVDYSELVPDKQDYAPEELVHFDYSRTAVKSGKFPMLILTLDSFENQDTGEIYPGTMAARVIKESGTVKLRATRRLPDYVSPGTYVLEGWVSSQQSRLTRASYYTSKSFTIKAAKQ